MDKIFDILEGIFSVETFGNLKLYDLMAIIFKYIFVIIIYYFIYNIIKMIYFDISTTSEMTEVSNTYLKLINRKESLPFKVHEHYYINEETTLGRGDSNDIVINDKFISKNHMRIIKDDGIYFIEDLGSANGTLLNGEPITEAIELKDKDLIDVGRIEFLFVNEEVDDD